MNTEMREVVKDAISRTKSQDRFRRAIQKTDIKRDALANFKRQLGDALTALSEGETLVILTQFAVVDVQGEPRGATRFGRSPALGKWRKAVLERDGHRCVNCGHTKDLQAHHKKSWAHHPDLRTEVSNGQTLCWLCHAAHHPDVPIEWFMKNKTA